MVGVFYLLSVSCFAQVTESICWIMMEGAVVTSGGHGAGLEGCNMRKNVLLI